MSEYIHVHINFLLLICFIIGFIIGFYIRHRDLKKREAEIAKAVELLYSRNIDRTIQNLKEKEFEETAIRNEDKL